MSQQVKVCNHDCVWSALIGNQVLNPPFVHDIQLVATAKKEHAVAAALGDGRLYWYYPNAPKPSKAADPVAYWVDYAHAAAISCVATPTGTYRLIDNASEEVMAETISYCGDCTLLLPHCLRVCACVYVRHTIV
eukprot:COSAG02_NODE_307_length_25111_cov_5.306693_14_plen_134_part_00